MLSLDEIQRLKNLFDDRTAFGYLPAVIVSEVFDALTECEHVTAERDRLRTAITEFLLSWEQVEPHINAVTLMSAIHGAHYTGPQLRIDLLKDAIR